MKKVLKFSLTAMFISQICLAQDVGVNAGGHQYSGVSAEVASYISNYDTNLKNEDLSHTNLIGSVYINKEFALAKVVNVEPYFKIRYNAYIDEMEIDCIDDVRYLLKTPSLKVIFKENNKTYQVYSYLDDIELKKGFFKVLEAGNNISLLAKETITFLEEEIPTSGYDKYSPPTLKRSKDKLFIGFKNNTTTKLPHKKRDILKLFSSKSKEIENFSKKNKLNYKNQEDLIKIFSYYNSL